MPEVARDGDDFATGHGCDAISQLTAPWGEECKVFANEIPVVCEEDPTVPHLIGITPLCVIHVAEVIKGSPNVFVGTNTKGVPVPIARVDDPVDSGVIIEGSPNVFANDL